MCRTIKLHVPQTQYHAMYTWYLTHPLCVFQPLSISLQTKPGRRMDFSDLLKGEKKILIQVRLRGRAFELLSNQSF